MAGEWIKFEANTPEKPEVFAITTALGWDDPDLTVGKLLKVWRWFDQHTINGNAPNVTLALLDRISGVTGFAKAMLDVGWLVQDEAGVGLPHFDRHNGQTAKDRALTAKRVAKHKANAGGNVEGNDASVSGSLPREEKKREELKEPPLPPTGGKSTRRRKAEHSLANFLECCKQSGERPIRDYQPIWKYASEAKLSPDLVALAWAEFVRKFGPGGTAEDKRQKDWRKTFQNYVESNYLKLWAVGKDGDYYLTSLGKQAEKVHETRAAA